MPEHAESPGNYFAWDGIVVDRRPFVHLAGMIVTGLLRGASRDSETPPEGTGRPMLPDNEPRRWWPGLCPRHHRPPKPSDRSSSDVIQRNELAGGRVSYTVRLRDPNGREYRRTFPTKKQADAYHAAELADRARGKWVDPRLGAVPFAVIAGQWLESNPAKRPKTLAADRSTIDLHLTPTLGARPIQAITRAHVQALVNEWARTAQPATVTRRYAVLRAICRHALDSDVIGRTPCRGIRLPEPTPRTRRHIITGAELDRLAAAMPDHLAAMPRVGAELGLRWGETAGLKVQALDLMRRRLTVEWTVGELSGRIIQGPPKSVAGYRTIVMPAGIADLLARHLQAVELTGADGDSFLFRGPGGGPLGYTNWRRRVWQPAVTAAGLPAGFRFHDLRRANATVMVARGVDPKTAQTRLGHADLRTTMQWYVQADAQADENAADALGEHFGGDSPSRHAGGL